MSMHRRFGALLAAGSMLALSGCVSLLPETEPDTIYRLSPSPALSVDLVEAPEMTVLLDRIVAPRGLSGARIALQQDRAIAYMAGAVWISPAPSLLENLIGQALDSKAPVLASARAEDGVQTQYELDLRLSNFEAVYDQGPEGAPLVRVSIRARVIDRTGRDLIASRVVSFAQRARDNRQTDIIDAFSDASSQVSLELASWVEAQLCARNPSVGGCR